MAIHKIKFFTGRASRYLAEKIVAAYGTTLGECEVVEFSDGEFQPHFIESIRGCTVFIIQSTWTITFFVNYSRLPYSGEGLVILQGMTVAASLAAAVANTVRYLKTKDME